MKEQPTIRFWEIALSAFALVLGAIVTVQRHLIYSKGKWGLFTEDSLPLALWGLIAFGVILASRPWNVKSRFGSHLRCFSMVAALCSAAYVCLIVTGWGRYQITRFESLRTNLGISSLSDGQRARAWAELTNPHSGYYICRDKQLLMRLSNGDRELCLENSRYARSLLSSLLHQGLSVEELNNNDFLLAGLLAEADPQPWHKLDYVPRPASRHESSIGLTTGLLSDQQAKKVVQTAMAELETIDRYTCQALVFCLTYWPSLFETGQGDALLKRWASLFREVEPLAVEGLVTRDIVKSYLGPGSTVKVRFELSGLKNQGASHLIEWFSVPQSIMGLLRSCGKDVVEVEAGEDVLVRANLYEIPHHTYSVPTYKYETYYETEYSYTGSTYPRTRSSQVKKTRQVSTGSETKTSYAPVLEVSMETEQGQLELERTLLYWHHLHYDHENQRFLQDKNGSVYGRMWPFGIDKKLYNFGFLKPDYYYDD